MCRENVFTLFEDLTCGRIDDIEGWLPYCCEEGGLCEGLRNVCTPMGVRQQLDVAQQMYDYAKPIFDALPRPPAWDAPYEGTVGPSIKSTDLWTLRPGTTASKWETWHPSVPATFSFPSLEIPRVCQAPHRMQSCFSDHQTFYTDSTSVTFCLRLKKLK